MNFRKAFRSILKLLCNEVCNEVLDFLPTVECRMFVFVLFQSVCLISCHCAFFITLVRALANLKNMEIGNTFLGH